MKKQLSTKYKYIVENGFEGEIREYLKKKYMYSSRVITRIIKEGKLTLNNEDVFFSHRCKSDDIIEVIFPREYPDSIAEDIPLSIVYEDEDVLLVNKNPTMVVHPTKSHQSGTLSNGIYGYFEKINHVGKIRFVNRLDMGTSGIVLGAKNKYVHHFLQQQHHSSMKKFYYAICENCPEEEKGLIDAPIKREEEYSIFRVVRADGDRSLTEYEVLGTTGKFSLLRLRLLTGRTHQIRVHLKYIGCPIVGDSLYNPDSIGFMTHQALHAGNLSFIHPRDLKEKTFFAPFPNDFHETAKKTGLADALNTVAYDEQRKYER